MPTEDSALDRDHAVGIIGAGHAGTAWARTALRAGRKVVIANNHGPESLRSAVAALGEGVLAGTVDEAAACPIVVVAVPWAAIPAAVAGIDWAGRTVIDGTNPLLFPELTPAPLGGRTSSEVVADQVRGALLVKAGNHLSAELLGQDPLAAGGRRVVFVSGDSEDAKQAVVDLIDSAGFYPIDLGDLQSGGRMQQFGGPLAGRNLLLSTT
jgi:8-hydroxy-5-deazaflavin:NADPH oxidoreductase